MPIASTSPTSSSPRLATRGLALALLISGCGRFPRDNPVEDQGTLSLERSADAVTIDDQVNTSPFNNDNGLVEPRETVLLTIPIDVRGVTEPLTASIDVDDRNDGRCVDSVAERGAAGSQLAPLPLPATNGTAPSLLLVSGVEITLGEEDCAPDMPLEFALRMRIVERDEELVVPFAVEVSALDGDVALDGVVVEDDASGDDDRELDPGETLYVVPSLENAGASLLRAVQLDVSDDDRACVQSVVVRQSPSARVIFGDLSAGAVAYPAQGTLELVVDADCGAGDSVELTFDVRDASDQRWSLPWSADVAMGVDAGTSGDDAGTP